MEMSIKKRKSKLINLKNTKNVGKLIFIFFITDSLLTLRFILKRWVRILALMSFYIRKFSIIYTEYS